MNLFSNCKLNRRARSWCDFNYVVLPDFYLQLSSIVSPASETPDFLWPFGERTPLSIMVSALELLPWFRFGFNSSISAGVCENVYVRMCLTLRLEDKMYSGTIRSADLRSPNLEVMTLGAELKNPLSHCSLSLFLHLYTLPQVFHISLSFPSSCPLQKVLP